MPNRRKIRELAMQALFAWDAHGAADPIMAQQVIEQGSTDHAVRRQATESAEGAWNQREAIDAQLERLAPQWPPRRQPSVDRNILRMAVWEMTNTQTPPKVVLDEAIEMAKIFSTEQSAAFVNGVLDAVLREHLALISPEASLPVNSNPEPLTPET
jgi:transcription antitermination protein NusB